MSKTVDINKDTIMKMLRTDVFGFKAEEIENKAKEVFNLVSGAPAEKRTDVKMVGGYVRTMDGFIIITPVKEVLAGIQKKKK